MYALILLNAPLKSLKDAFLIFGFNVPEIFSIFPSCQTIILAYCEFSKYPPSQSDFLSLDIDNAIVGSPPSVETYPATYGALICDLNFCSYCLASASSLYASLITLSCNASKGERDSSRSTFHPLPNSFLTAISSLA